MNTMNKKEYYDLIVTEIRERLPEKNRNDFYLKIRNHTSKLRRIYGDKMHDFIPWIWNDIDTIYKKLSKEDMGGKFGLKEFVYWKGSNLVDIKELYLVVKLTLDNY